MFWLNFDLDSFFLFLFFGGMKRVLLYQWLEDSLTTGERVSEDMYDLKMESESEAESIKCKSSAEKSPKRNVSSDEEDKHESSDSKKKKYFDSNIKANTDTTTTKSTETALTFYNPPDLNKNITQIFGKLSDIYRGKSTDQIKKERSFFT